MDDGFFFLYYAAVFSVQDNNKLPLNITYDVQIYSEQYILCIPHLSYCIEFLCIVVPAQVGRGAA